MLKVISCQRVIWDMWTVSISYLLMRVIILTILRAKSIVTCVY